MKVKLVTQKIAITYTKTILRCALGVYRLVGRRLIGDSISWGIINACTFLIYNIPALGKWLLQRWYWNGKGTIILFYHEIDSHTFERHIKLIKKHWRIISLDTLIEHINKKQEPGNSIVITFDDGWKSNYTEIFPVVSKMNAPITIYVVSDMVGTEKEFWWITVNNLSAISTSKQVRLQAPHYYETIPNKQRIAEISGAIERLQYTPRGRCTLSFKEIEEMLDSELITFGSHSRTHPCLSMTEQEEAEEEIIGSKSDLVSNLKVNITHFSYPHGSYNESHIEMLKRGGYVSAVTTTPGVNDVQTDPYQLERVPVPPQAGGYTLAMMITGIWHLLGLDNH